MTGAWTAGTGVAGIDSEEPEDGIPLLEAEGAVENVVDGAPKSWAGREPLTTEIATASATRRFAQIRQLIHIPF